MKRTPLYDAHRAAGGRLIDFSGWDMPIQYSGVLDEYYAVRRTAGLFDVSHMGRIRVRGRGAQMFLQRVTTNDVAALRPGDSHYSMICNDTGGIKDDVFVYHLPSGEYLVCVNASNREKIVAWLGMQARQDDVELLDASTDLAQLALQGPSSRSILEQWGVRHLEHLKPRGCLESQVGGLSMLVTRTGYTGELGYELYVPAVHALAVWNALMQVGKEAGVKPAGLGARDLLRLDMAYLLYGNDMDEHITPIEASAAWVVSLNKDEFVGRSVLQRQLRDGTQRRLIAFELSEKAVPRHGCQLLPGAEATVEVGEVTSGNLSPILQKGIGLGYVPEAMSPPGTSLWVDIRGRRVPATVVKPPFYRRQPARGDRHSMPST